MERKKIALGKDSRRFSFEVTPSPIPKKEIMEVITADVVVVGAGLAGLTAAGSAAEKGAKFSS